VGSEKGPKEGWYVNRVKTWVLIAALGGLFVVVGGAITRSTTGLIWGLVIGLGFNLAMYWFSDKIAVATTRSKPVTEQEYPQLYRIVRELIQGKDIPMPRIYVSDMMQPNAFATGRNPRNAVVAVTKGILQILDERELRGVLAHELSHVTNRDILIGTIAAGIAMSITFIARMAFWFGGGRDDRDSAFGPFAMIFAWILAPIAALLIQMAVSRSREFQADESGAELSHDPISLANALRKLESASKKVPAPATVTEAQAHLFIINPFKGRGAQFARLFMTHPSTDDRVERLERMARQGI
jgi:heat shock protein HtpX